MALNTLQPFSIPKHPMTTAHTDALQLQIKFP